MRIGARLAALWRNLFARKRVEGELDAELQGWIDEFIAREIKRGVSPDEARRKAMAELGGLKPVKERVRAERIGFAIEAWFRDVRHAFRALGRRPGLTAAAVLTMALGIGANSTVFTLASAVFLTDLPFEDPHEIAYVQPNSGIAFADFVEIRQESRSLDVGAYSGFPANLSGPGAVGTVPERVPGARISTETFSILGQTPAMGRDLAPTDVGIEAAPVALISHTLWQNRYAEDPEIVGQPMRINLVDHTIVGVMPEGEAFPSGTRVWLPYRLTDENDRTLRNVALWGRLADGATFDSAEAELNTIADRIRETHYTETDQRRLGTLDVMPFRDRNVSDELRTVFIGLVGAVGFVLLIACANVANLLLSRVLDRGREMAIRSALGAERWLIARQVLVESLVMSFAGGALGLGFAVVAVDWIDRMTASTGPPYWLDFGLDYRVVAHFFVVCLAAGLLFGVLPALRMARIGDARHLTDRAATARGRERTRVASVLVVAEVAMTIVLLVGAGLMFRSFVNTTRITAGFDVDDVLTAGVLLPGARYPEPSRRTEFAARLLDRAASFPGSLAVSSDFPADGASIGTPEIEGRDLSPAPGDAAARPPRTSVVSVTPGYFETLGVTLDSGRDFTWADDEQAPPVVIVDTLFARRYWPGQDPIGRRIRVPDDPAFMDVPTEWATVVGVSPRINFMMPMNDEDPNAIPNLFVPLAQDDAPYLAILARGGATTEDSLAHIREALDGVDPDVPMADVRTMDDILWERMWPYRIFSTLFGTFAAGALLMSAVGLYGVTAYGVTVRQREFGIRMALGAGRTNILWMVFRQGLGRTGIGVFLGLLVAIGVSQVLESVLYEVEPGDPVTFLAVAVILGAIALFACLVPASRAVRVDPGASLRQS